MKLRPTNYIIMQVAVAECNRHDVEVEQVCPLPLHSRLSFASWRGMPCGPRRLGPTWGWSRAILQLRYQISGAREQHIQIFLLHCKWFPSFSFLFGAARRVIMQTKTCFKMKGTTYREEEISEYAASLLQRLDACFS